MSKLRSIVILLLIIIPTLLLNSCERNTEEKILVNINNLNADFDNVTFDIMINVDKIIIREVIISLNREDIEVATLSSKDGIRLYGITKDINFSKLIINTEYKIIVKINYTIKNKVINDFIADETDFKTGALEGVHAKFTELLGSRTSITVNVLLTDENQMITSGTFCASIYDKDDALLNTIYFSETIYIKQSKEFTYLKTDETYTIKLFASSNNKKYLLAEEKITTSMEGTKENPVLIRTIDEFLQIKRDSTAYFKLLNDIDFNGEYIIPMFTESTPFEGHIIGNGKTIKNFKFESSTAYHGMFGYLAFGSSIKDVNFQDVTATIFRANDTYFGIVAGINKGTIENVNVSNVEINFTVNGSGKMHIGTLVGLNSEQGKINNCHVESSQIIMTARNYAYVGGLVGFNSLSAISSERTEITNSSAEVDIELNHSLATSYNIELYIGGFVGINQTTIDSCTSRSRIITNTSKTTSTTEVYYLIVGGFIAACDSTSLVKDCAAVVDINVTSKDILSANIGGFIGKLTTADLSIIDCVLIAKNSKIIVNITTKLKKDDEENFIEEYNLAASTLIASALTECYQTTYLLGTIESNFTEQNVIITPNVINNISGLTLSVAVLTFINSNK